MKSRNLDLTKGSIWGRLCLFFLPILAGSMFQQLYTTADAVIVGQFAGKEGLAAIDSVYSFLKLPVNFLTGLSAGAAILLSQFFGAGEKERFFRYARTAIGFTAAAGLLFSAAGFLFSPSFLKWLQVPEGILPMSLAYVQIYFGGFIFSMIYNLSAGILRAMGNSRTPLFILLISGGANVLLDLAFVAKMGHGTAGAALATAMAQALSALLALRQLAKSGVRFSIFPPRFKPDVSALREILLLGLPIGLQSSLYPIANMMMQSSINAFGTNAIAAWALCGKLDFIIWLAADSMADAVSTFSAQNFGAGQFKRIRRGVWVGLGLGFGIISAAGAVLFFWCEPLGVLFLGAGSGDVIPLAGTLMRFMAPFYAAYVPGVILSGAVRGTGETFRPMLLTLCGTCASRILWVLLAVPRFQALEAVIAGFPMSWMLNSLIFAVFYAIFLKKRLPAKKPGAGNSGM